MPCHDMTWLERAIHTHKISLRTPHSSEGSGVCYFMSTLTGTSPTKGGDWEPTPCSCSCASFPHSSTFVCRKGVAVGVSVTSTPHFNGRLASLLFSPQTALPHLHLAKLALTNTPSPGNHTLCCRSSLFLPELQTNKRQGSSHSQHPCT